MALGDRELFQNLLDTISLKPAIFRVVMKHKWGQERLLNALHECGIPAKSEGNVLYFQTNVVYKTEAIRKYMEDNFLKKYKYDYVEFQCET